MSRSARVSRRKIETVVQGILATGLIVTETQLLTDGTIRILSSITLSNSNELDSADEINRKLLKASYGKN